MPRWQKRRIERSNVGAQNSPSDSTGALVYEFEDCEKIIQIITSGGFDTDTVITDVRP